MAINRREFIKQGAAIGLGGVVTAGAGQACASEPAAAALEGMGVLVDLTKCNGCRQCEAACKKVNGFPELSPESLKDPAVFEKQRRPAPDSYTVVNAYRPSDDAEAVPTYAKVNCLHCVDPACVSACLVGALRKQSEGAVTYDAWKCMGCRYCMVACPFEIPKYEYANVFTPQVRKCTFCRNEGNPNRDGVPACVQACPKECLIHGKRSDVLHRAHQLIADHPDRYVDHVYGEHEAGGTSWLYVSGVPFERVGFLSVPLSAPPRLSETVQHGVFVHFVPPVAWCAILALTAWVTRPVLTAPQPGPTPPPQRSPVERKARDEQASVIGALR